MSLTSALESIATVASFRTWRGSQPIAAKGPMLIAILGGERGIRTLGTR
jgi:hypothetical protein